MAKEISGFIKLQIKGGQANPAPPVGPALGQRGVNIMEFCKAFNDKTKSMAGKPIPVEITEHSNIENVSFNANLFKDVLVANKECETATLEVSEKGLAKINFKVDQYDVTYYLVAVQDVD